MGRRRVLVVDDEATIRDVLEQILTLKGCETREAANADEALVVLDGWQPDVVLLDIAMPGMNGLQLLVELKRTIPETEVVMITSYASADAVQHAIRGGAHDFIVKPFTIPEVWDSVERAFDKRHPLRDGGVREGSVCREPGQ